MKKFGMIGTTIVAVVIACDGSNAEQQTPPPAKAEASGETVPRFVPAVLREPPAANRQVQDQRYEQAARAAWQVIDRGYSSSTGFATAQPSWPYPTIWDIASTLGAYYSARGLGLISDQEYGQRVSRALETLKKARLYNGIAYGRNYDVSNGELVGPDQKPHANGTGYSAIDIGRLLVWLAIIARNDPALAPAATAVARRIDATRALRDGYMRGEELSKKTGRPSNYQEGRIGYEQYAGTGFTLWDMNAAQAVNLQANASVGSVFGIPIMRDKRGLDRLTSEPIILYGLELGWDPGMRELAWQTLSAQAARFLKTGQVTIASEDALNKEPYYFYYYCIYCSGKEFVINVHTPGVELTEPRWVSTKATFAWHALLPSKYSWQAMETVAVALDEKSGWATGVYEGSGKSTQTYSLNTAAIILEAALYRKTGKPLLLQSR